MVSTRPPKYAQLYDDLLGLIVSGAFRPGDRIAIKDLAGRLGVSPTPTREVLSRLAGRGIVEERRSEGFYLSRLDPRDTADFYDLHGASVLRAIVLCPPASVRQLTADSAWDLFAQFGQLAGNAAITEVRDYLDDRLKLVRRIEDQLVPDPLAELAQLTALTATGSLAELKVGIRRYHARRKALASEITLALTRTSRRI